MNPFATKLAEAFASKLFQYFYAESPIDQFVNRDYEGDVNRVGSVVNILTLQKDTEQDYDGSDLTASNLYESNCVLTLDQQKSFYPTFRTIDKWKSYIKNPEGTVIQQEARERKKNVMKYLLGFYGDAASGQWYGTDYTTGTVAVTATTGAVTGSGTTFTSAMVGKPFKATGHTKWYRVKSYSSATSIVIENDSDDLDSAYDGGTIDSGASYVIQANTAQAIDNGGSNPTFLTMVLQLAQYLDDAEIPAEDRVLFVPSVARTTIMKDTGIKINVPQAWEPMVQKGLLTELEGFKIVVLPTSYFPGDNSNGIHVVAAHKSWLTFADKVLEAQMEEQIIGNFGVRYKDLYVYGAKVADIRRPSAAHAFVTFG